MILALYPLFSGRALPVQPKVPEPEVAFTTRILLGRETPRKRQESARSVAEGAWRSRTSQLAPTDAFVRAPVGRSPAQPGPARPIQDGPGAI